MGTPTTTQGKETLAPAELLRRLDRAAQLLWDQHWEDILQNIPAMPAWLQAEWTRCKKAAGLE